MGSWVLHDTESDGEAPVLELVTYPYMNMGNVHRMFITYIHRT